MIRRYSIVLNPADLAPLYIGAEAEEAKQLIRQRKAEGLPVVGWINVRPEKRFVPTLKASTPVDVTPDECIDEDIDEANPEIESLLEIAKGDARKKEVKEAREKLDELGVEY